MLIADNAAGHNSPECARYEELANETEPLYSIQHWLAPVRKFKHYSTRYAHRTAHNKCGLVQFKS